MKKLALLTVLTFINVSLAQNKQDWNGQLRVMSYNVHHCAPTGGQPNIPAIAKVIENCNADLVALQEIDDHNERSGLDINQAEELAKLLKMYYCYEKAFDFSGGTYGVAILSKFPIEETQGYPLPKKGLPDEEQRILLTTAVVLPTGQRIRFASTHLDFPRKSNEGKEPETAEIQIDYIYNLAIQDMMSGIVGGDFNATEDSNAIKKLKSYFSITCNNCPFTCPQDVPTSAIDYIAFSKGDFKVLSHEVIDEKVASDHRPILSVLEKM